MADLKKGRTSSKRSLALSATDWGRQSVCGWDELGVGEAPRHVVFSESVTATEPFTFFGEAFHHSHELIVESVLGCRKGNILGPGTILKADNVVTDLTCASHFDMVRLSGAHAFRQAPALPIYAVAQPTRFGVNTVLNYIELSLKAGGAQDKPHQILWLNLREEPVVYINGRSFVLREEDQPFRNVSEYGGLDASRIEAMEQRLKDEVLEEAQSCNGSILLHDESLVPSPSSPRASLMQKQVVSQWEAVSTDTVQTPLDVFDGLDKEGYPYVKYYRVPVSPGAPPDASFYDHLIQILMTVDRKAHVVLNCQFGRRRSTVAMVISVLVMKIRYDKSFHNIPRSKLSTPSEKDSTNSGDSSNASEEVESMGCAKYLQGNFMAVVRLLQVLDEGRVVKQQVDWAIENCAAFTHLRHYIWAELNKAIHSTSADLSKYHREAAAIHLRTYCDLISFTSYVTHYFARHPSAIHCEGSGDVVIGLASTKTKALRSGIQVAHEKRNLLPKLKQSFSEWMRQRPEISSIMKSEVGRWPLDMMNISLHQRPVPSPGSGDGSAHTADDESGMMEDAVAQQLVTNRNGQVLAEGHILKMDHFTIPLSQSSLNSFRSIPGCPRIHWPLPAKPSSASSHSSSSSPAVSLSATDSDSADSAEETSTTSTAPSIFSLCTPTISGIHHIWNALHSDCPGELLMAAEADKLPQPRPRYKYPVVWINLREELSVFIKGRPVVLRYLSQPRSNIMSYAGINATRVEKLEEQLKEDILEEGRANGGRILLHDETVDGRIIEVWEEISRPEDVLTFRDVFSVLLKRRHSNKSRKEKGHRLGESTESQRKSKKKIETDDHQEQAVRRHRRHNHRRQRLHKNDVYCRIPFTADHPPSEVVLDNLTALLRNVDDQSRFALSCQTAGSRGTIASILTIIYFEWKRNKSGPFVPSQSLLPSLSAEAGGKNFYFKHLYGPVMSLLRVIENGPARQQQVDGVIERCSATYNVIKAVDFAYDEALEHANSNDGCVFARKVHQRLLTYLYLLLFNAYLSDVQPMNHVEYNEQKERAQNHQRETELLFSGWLAKHSELSSVMRPLSRDISFDSCAKTISELSIEGESGESLVAPFCPPVAREKSKSLLSVSFKPEEMPPDGSPPWWTRRMSDAPPVSVQTQRRHSLDLTLMLSPRTSQQAWGKMISEASADNFGLPSPDSVIKCRSGNVLHRGMIMKSDHFPGCQRHSMPIYIEGAPNFRKVEGSRIYGVAIPTPPGIYNLCRWIYKDDKQEWERKQSHEDDSDDDEEDDSETMSSDDGFNHGAPHQNKEILVEVQDRSSSILHGALHIPPLVPKIKSLVLGGGGKGASDVNLSTVKDVTKQSDMTVTGGRMKGDGEGGGKGLRTNHQKELEKAWTKPQKEWPKPKLIWINLREEPILYINDRPFVLRKKHRPFSNFEEYTGIDGFRVEQMEERLKRDILKEAALYGGRFLVTDEEDDGSIVHRWEKISPSTVYTVQDVYKMMKREGDHISYHRMPITDEQMPEEQDFQEIYEAIQNSDEDTHIIFNCQMGRGRTTTGMVVAALYRSISRNLEDMDSEHDEHDSMIMSILQFDDDSELMEGDRISRNSSEGSSCAEERSLPMFHADASRSSGHERASAERLVRVRAAEGKKDRGLSHPILSAVKKGHSTFRHNSSSKTKTRERSLSRDRRELQQKTFQSLLDMGAEMSRWMRGEFTCIRRLIRVLPDGYALKSHVDVIIDRCAALQNLRVAIVNLRMKSRSTKATEEEQKAAMERGLHYLERYFYLICFAGFLADKCAESSDEEITRASASVCASFPAWMADRPEIYSILKSSSLD